VAIAAAMAAMGALATVVFIKVLEAVIDLIWTTIPDRLSVDPYSLAFALPVCAAGGVLVGIARHFLGEQPKGLEEALAGYKSTHRFDYRHLPQGLTISLVCLGFGAALGPEAALVSLIGGIASWVGDAIKASERGSESVSYLGITASLGALFGTAGAAAVSIDPAAIIERDPDGSNPTAASSRRERVLLLIPGLVAAGVGAWIFKKLSGTSGYFHLDLPAYTFSVTDLGHGVWLGLVGFVIAALLLVAIRAVSVVTGPIARIRPLQSLVGGVVLGLLASLSHYALFSGHEGITDLLAPGVLSSAGYYAGLVLLKLSATSVCAGTGWKGGRFFPIMFIGSAAGLACAAAVSGVLPVVGLCAVMTGSVAALLKKPIPAILLMLFFFPPDLYPLVIVSGFVAGALAKRTAPRLPFIFGEPEPELI
jgi:H+/Cl- antiporter ClcA